MGRKYTLMLPQEIEDIVKECLLRVGIKGASNNQVALLTRLIFSGVAEYFYKQPDNKVRMGYIEFMKNPDKEQLFAVNILKSEGVGVINADTLWRYYKGELATEAQLKGVIDEFVHNLLEYAETQEQDIVNINNKTTVELTKKRRKKNGIQT